MGTGGEGDDAPARTATKRRDAEETMTHEERIALHEKMNRERKEREERRAAELKRRSEEAAAAAAKAADPDAIIEARRKAEEEERLRKEEHERRKLTGEDDRPGRGAHAGGADGSHDSQGGCQHRARGGGCREGG